MKRFIVNNKKIASIALSSAMVLSNAQFGTQTVLAKEVVETKTEEKENGDLEEVTSDVVVEATEATEEVASDVVVEATETVKTTPVKSVRAASSMTFTEIDVPGTLTVDDKGAAGITLTDTNAAGRLYTSAADQALSTTYNPDTQSYFLLPELQGDATFTATVNFSSLADKSDRGFAIGMFNGDPISSWAGSVVRGGTTNLKTVYRKGDASATAQSWTSGSADTLTDIVINSDAEFTFKRTSTGFEVSVTQGDKTFAKTYTSSIYPNLTDASKGMRFGFAITNTTAKITNAKLVDSTGATVYDQNAGAEVTTPTYTGFTKTVEANGDVTFTVTGTNLVPSDLSVKETATGGHSKDITGFTGTATQATLTVTPTANTTVEAGITYTYTLFDKTTQATGTNVNPLTVDVAYTGGEVEEGFDYEIIQSSANSLTVTENEDGTLSLVDTNNAGKFYPSAGDWDTTTQSYIMFPEMEGGTGKITTTFKVNSLPAEDALGNTRGVVVGSFSNNPMDSYIGMAVRGKTTTAAPGGRVVYRKGDGTWGSSAPSIEPTIAVGDVVTVVVERPNIGGVNLSISVNGGEPATKAYSNTSSTPHANIQNNAIAQRFGLGINESDITISDLVIEDKDGIEKYNLKADGGEVTPPTFTSFTKTENAETGEVTFKVVGTDLVADDLSIKETATGHEITFEGFETKNNNTEATLTITPSANTTVLEGITYTYTLYEGSEVAKDTTGTAIAPLTALVAYEEAATDFVKTGELDVTAYGQQLTLSNKNAAASLTTLANVGYYLLPTTTDDYTVTCDVEYAVGAASTNYGMLFGIVDDTKTPPYVSSLGIRSTNGLRGLYSKNTPYSVGAGGINSTFDNTKPISLKIQRNETGLYQQAIDANGTVNEYTISYGNMYDTLQAKNAPVKYGFVVANADVKIRNLLVVDAEGNIVYDQNEAYEADGNAPVVGTVTATKGTDDTNVKVDWTATTEGVGDGAYKVEYKKDDGEWTTLIKRTTEKTFTHDIVKLGKGTYTYRVTGYVGNTATTPVSSTPVVANPPFAASTLATIVAGDKSAALTWSANELATSYEVYRRSADEANFTLLTTVNAPTVTYTDTTVTNEMPYYYKIVGKSADNKSLDSNVMFTLPTAGHTGEYVHEAAAAKIAITSKSTDTVTDGKASIAGTIDKTGQYQLFVNGRADGAPTVITAGGTFSFTDIKLADGRNDVNIIFTDEAGKKTRKTFNFVNLTNYDYVVDPAFAGTAGALDADGHKQYKTIQAATDAAGATNTQRVVIYVKNGSYDELLRVTSPNVSLIGQDRDGVVIHNIATIGGSTETRTATIIKATAENFTAENLTFKHDHVYTGTGAAEQADALRTEADNSVFVNVKLSSFQDTLQTQVGDSLFYKCYIEGLVDFIYGGDGEAVFEDCDIVYRAHDVKKEGHIAAPKHEGASTTYGYIFNNSRLLAEDAINSYTDKTKYDLVRPWGKGAKVAFINTYMTEVLGLAANGGHSNGLGIDPMSVTLVENGTYGPGFVQTNVRKQISDAQAAALLAKAKTSFDSAAAAQALSDAYVKVEVPATVSSISPTSKVFASGGGTQVITVAGTNLTEDNIKLVTTSDAVISVDSITPTKATYSVTVPQNTSTTTAQTYLLKVELDGAATKLASTITVSKTSSSNNGGGGGSSSNSGGGSSIVKVPVNNTTTGTGDKTDNGVSNKPTTYTDKGVTVEVSQSLANKDNVSIDVKPATVSDDVKASLVETNAANETLLGESKTVSVIDNGTNVTKVNEAVKVSFDVSSVDLTDADKDKLIAVRIDETTGDITYLGGKLIDGVFVTETTKLDGDFAVIVADPKDYDQATFTINSTDLATNSGSVKLDAAPVIQNNTTFVPVRAISESLGANVTYDAATKTANISLNGKTTSFTTGVSKDGSPAPIIVNNRMLIPLRFVSESLDANVIWYAADKTIQVTK